MALVLVVVVSLLNLGLSQATAIGGFGYRNVMGVAGFASVEVLTGSTITSTTSTITSTVITTSTSNSLTITTHTSSTTLTAPFIVLNPNAGPVGLTVQVSGSGFAQSDSDCTLSGNVVVSQICSISGQILTGTFTVGNLGLGSYFVTATGLQAGDSASASFTVNAGPPSLMLNPSTANVGSTVQVTGSGFITSDNACSLSGDAVTSSSCSLANGMLSGSFIVGDVAPGSHTVTATGNPAGDSALATLQVGAAQPTISLNPSSAQVGANVQVTGSGFSPSDSGCSLSGGASVASETCSITNGALTASFIVANTASGPYTITVTGNPGGDAASATFSLIHLPVSITINPTIASVGTTVQVTGSGFSLSDTSCSLSSSAVSSQSCSVAGGVLSGSFVAANVASGPYTVTATGSSGDSAAATLNVISQTIPGIPGFPAEAILLGLSLGIILIILQRRNMRAKKP